MHTETRACAMSNLMIGVYLRKLATSYAVAIADRGQS